MTKRIIALILSLTLIGGLIPSVSAAPIRKEPSSRDQCCHTLRDDPLDVNYVRPDFDGYLIDITPQRVADTFAYLEEHYVNNHPEQALHVYTGTEEDRENLLTLAQTITQGCTTNRQKADAIGSWINRNINYDVNTSAYASDTFYRREGNCLSYANLMMFLLRSLGIPAVVGDGWRGDMKTSSVELFNMEGHAWCFVYLDGQWVLYDPLWIEGGTTDRDYMAEWIYFDTVEFIIPVTDGNNLPPRTSELPMPYWTNGNYYLYSNAFPTGTGTLSYFVNNQAYIFVSNQCEPEGSQDGRLYIDGRDKSDMVMGELYRDGWVSYGEYHNDKSMAHAYAFPNGMMADGYTMEFDGKLWYMSYDSAMPILMDEDDYWIQDGLVTMAPGYSGPWLGLRWQDGCFESSIGEVFLEYENCTPEVATVDDSGNITCHAEGYAEFRFMLKRRDRNGNITLMGSALASVFVSSENRTPDYRDLGSHTHEMVYSHSVEATCDNWGMDIYQCSGCVYTEEHYTTEPLGHEHQAVGTIDPTCTDYGYVVYECVRCGDSYYSAEIDMLGHDYVRSVFADPTCTEAGYGYYRCSRCQDERVEADTPALGHSYVGGICTRCGAAGESIASGTCGENLTWVLTEDGTLTISGTGSMYDFEYMETPWYSYLGDISAVVIQDGITRVGNNAFREGVNITTVTLSDSITEIGAWAFMGAEKLTGIVLPQYLQTLEQEAFLNCTSLEAIELPGTLTFFDGPFAGCTSLKRAVIHGDPDIPSFMMGSTPFRFCSSLEAIEVDENHFCLLSIDGVLYQRSGEELILMQYPAGKQDTVYELAPKTCQIFQMAMEDVDALEELIIPGTVQILDEFALMSCDNLHTIRFEGDAPQFGAEVFWGNTTTVYYPEGNATWTSDVMQDYSGTITWVPYEVSDAVASGTCGEDVTWELDEDGTLTISGTGEMTSAPWRYDEYASLEIKAVIIEEGVTSICSNAFRDCESLTSVTFPAAIAPLSLHAESDGADLSRTLTTIGNHAFHNCFSLTQIVLPPNLQSIGDSAFYSCIGLTDILFTGDAPDFGYTCFWQVDATVWFPADNETWTGDAFDHHGETNILWASYDSDVVEAKGGAWGQNIVWAFDEATGTLTFTGSGDMDSTESFSYYPWYYFSDEITDVVIGEGITNVPQYAFYTYPNLESVTLGGDVKTLEPLAFMECYSLTRIQLPEGLQTIGHNCFSSSGLTEIQIPASVTSIGSSAFSETALTSLVIPGGVTLDDGVFSLCFQLKTVEIQDGVKELPMMLFGQCSALETVYLPGSITRIDMGVFGGCDSLATVYFTGDCLTCLEEWTFYDMTFTAYYPANNATWTADKLQNYGGTITWVPYNYVKWYSGTTSLNGTIDLNIYVLLSQDLVNDPNTFVRFTYDGNVVDVPMADAQHSPTAQNPNRYRFSCPIYAKQLADKVNVVFMKGSEQIGKALSYSVVQYCENQIKKVTDPQELALYKAMLNYGAAAQQMFGHNLENLANASLSEADKVLPSVNASAYKYSISGKEDGIKAKSATLMLEDVVKVRVYFTLTGTKAIEDYTFTIDGQVVTPQYNDKGYYVETDGIAAKDLEKMFSIQVGGITVKYGALSFVNSKANGSNVLEANISKALYVYWQAADSYLG